MLLLHRKYGGRIGFGFSCALLGFAYAMMPVAHAQQPDTVAPNVMQLVRDASYNELHASNGGHPVRYRVQKVDDGVSTVKEVIETKDGSVSRLLEKGGKPLSAEANQAELARLNELRDHPEQQAAAHKKSSENDERDNEMVRLLPEAFIYTYLGTQPGASGPAYRLAFKPNPAFTPPDRQAQVYHGMAGELWVDVAQKRMVRFDAHLTEDVDFGWGIFGRLFKGGTIFVDQKDVGDRHWEVTHLRLHLTGKILMFKSLKIFTTEDSSNFQRVPDDGYQAAIAMLEQMPAPTAAR